MSDFDVVIPKVAPPAEGADDDDRKDCRPHWGNVARTLLDNQLTYCELILLNALHMIPSSRQPHISRTRTANMRIVYPVNLFCHF